MTEWDSCKEWYDRIPVDLFHTITLTMAQWDRLTPEERRTFHRALEKFEARLTKAKLAAAKR